LSYITDDTGREISEGYHELMLFIVPSGYKHPQLRGLIGKIGATSYVLRPPTEDDPRFVQSKEGFHELEFRADLGGCFVARTGAMKTIVGPEGVPATKGYHEFFMRDGKLFGQTDYSIEEVNIVHNKGNPKLLPRT
jgi:hypothetical protein